MNMKKYLLLIVAIFLNLKTIFAAVGGIYVDTTPPSISIISPTNKSMHGKYLEINTIVSDDYGVGECWIEYNNRTTYYDCFRTSVTLQNYENWITIYAKDQARNVNSTKLLIYKDVTPPNIIDHGYSPGNNTLLTDEYEFWIKVSENFQLQKVNFYVNGILKQTFYENWSYFSVKISLNNSINRIKWEVCDVSELCDTIEFDYYIIIPYAPVISLSIDKSQVIVGNSVRITYSISDFDSANLTIIKPNGDKKIISITRNSGYFNFNETSLLGTYVILLSAVKYNYSSQKTQYFEVVPEPTTSFRIISKYNKPFHVIFERENERFEYTLYPNQLISLSPVTYDINISGFDNSFNLSLSQVLLVQSSNIRLEKKISLDGTSIVYHIDPNFAYKEALIEMSIDELNASGKEEIKVYGCESYNFDTGKCLSFWKIQPFAYNDKNNVVIIKTKDIFTYRIVKLLDTCEFKVKVPDYIKIDENKVGKFEITIYNVQCTIPFSIMVLGVSNFVPERNNFFIDIGSSEEISILIEKPQNETITLQVNDKEYEIPIVYEKQELKDLVVSPSKIVTRIFYGRSDKKCIEITNLGGEYRKVKLNSTFNLPISEIVLAPYEKRTICFNLSGSQLGVFKEEINVTSENLKTKVTVEYTVLPESEIGVDVILEKDVFESNERIRGEIFVVSKSFTTSRNVCYYIVNERKEIIRSKCVFIELNPAGSILVGKYQIDEDPLNPGEYTIFAYLNGTTSYTDSEKFYVYSERMRKLAYATVVISAFLGVLSVWLFWKERRKR